MKRRRCVILGIVFLAVGLLLAAWCDWFHPLRPWPRATGWDRIPPAERPQPEARLWDAAGAPRLFWLGHAGFVLRWHERTLLFDPNVSGRCTIARRQMENVDLRGLGPVDAVLISHAHYDHLDLPTLEALDGPALIAVPDGAADYLPESLRAVARSMRVHTVLTMGPLEFVAVPAQHNGNRFHPLKSSQAAVGWIVRDGEDAIYVAGDTGFNGPQFEAVRERYEPRVALLPIGAYSPRVILKPHHLSPEEAVRAGVILGVETVVPAHFGTFTLFFDRPAAALPRFARAAKENRLAWKMPMLLNGSDEL